MKEIPDSKNRKVRLRLSLNGMRERQVEHLGSFRGMLNRARLDLGTAGRMPHQRPEAATGESPDTQAQTPTRAVPRLTGAMRALGSAKGELSHESLSQF